MIKLIFIRHGATCGNLERRYIGSTDEPLCKMGIDGLLAAKAAGMYPEADTVYCSPMKRAIQSAEIIYPDNTITLVDGFREKDFGRYEKKRAEDLIDDLPYQSWVSGGGKEEFPDGEPFIAVKERVISAFDKILGKHLIEGSAASIAFVVHGGTIMTVMSERLFMRGGYFDYQCGNGAAVLTHFADGRLIFDEKRETGDGSLFPLNKI